MFQIEKWEYFPWNLYFYTGSFCKLDPSLQIVLFLQGLHFLVTVLFTLFFSPVGILMSFLHILRKKSTGMDFYAEISSHEWADAGCRYEIHI